MVSLDQCPWLLNAEGGSDIKRKVRIVIINRLLVGFICLVAALALPGCAKRNGPPPATESANNQSSPTQGVEKIRPTPGTGNVQGKVLFNSAPVENIQVKLCETFSRFLSGCGGKTYTAQTDKDGDYVITNVEPKEYEALTVRVFDTGSYVFATTGIGGLSAAKYNVVADKTLFVTPTNLFKGDLKVVNPKAGARVSGQDLELKWDSYPNAAYYKFSIYPEDSSIASPHVNERVEGTTFKLNKPLEKGTYRWRVEAFNGSDKKLSESSDEIKFTVD